MNEAWLAGREAYGDGDDKSDCPYRSGPNRAHWIAGWEDAWENDDSDDRQPD